MTPPCGYMLVSLSPRPTSHFRATGRCKTRMEYSIVGSLVHVNMLCHVIAICTLYQMLVLQPYLWLNVSVSIHESWNLALYPDSSQWYSQKMREPREIHHMHVIEGGWDLLWCTHHLKPSTWKVASILALFVAALACASMSVPGY